MAKKESTKPAKKTGQIRVQIILDEKLAQKIRDDAWKARMSVSEWIRKLAQEA